MKLEIAELIFGEPLLFFIPDSAISLHRFFVPMWARPLLQPSQHADLKSLPHPRAPPKEKPP